MFAPASRHVRVTAGGYVSTETKTPARRNSLMTGISLLFCAVPSARAAWASVDSAPMSTMSAPCAVKTLPRWTAASAVRQTLSRYHESGERLTTPMMAGCELKAKGRPPTENSFTRADAAARFFSNNPASCSSVNMRQSYRKIEKEETVLKSAICNQNGAPAAIRTRDPLLRRQMLYPSELRAQPKGH